MAAVECEFHLFPRRFKSKTIAVHIWLYMRAVVYIRLMLPTKQYKNNGRA